MIVVDTNLIVNYCFETPATGVAAAVFAGDPVWTAPHLWRSEFRNVLTQLIRRGRVALNDAVRLANEAEHRMAGRQFVVVTADVLRLTTDSGCSAYDCEFVALAQDLGTRLVTSDVEVLKAFPGLAVAPERFARQ